MVSFKGKKVLVMGLGLHGGALAVVKWLLKHKAIISITDIKTTQQLKHSLDKVSKMPNSKKIKYTLGGHKLEDFINQDLIIQNPGVPADSKYLSYARENNIPVINEAVMFFGLYPGSAIGVTGTRGKSTTSTLIHKILKTTIKTNVVAGNIATYPMMEALTKLKVNSLPVLELSSWHLELMDTYQVSPHIAVVTNVLNDHLNRYKSFNHYKEAKRAILKHQVKSDKVVLNYDNSITRSFAKKSNGSVYYYSLNKKVKGVYLKNNKIYFNDSYVMDIDHIKLLGDHNLANILAAICVAKIVGIKNDNIAKAINSFKGIPYRLEYKTSIDNLKIYNDSTSTTPDASLAAISSFADQKIILIAGGEDKNLDYSKLARKIKSKVAYTILLSGSGSDKLVKELNKLQYSKISKNIKTLKEAFNMAISKSELAEVLLFSPAAASFNMFDNEFDRARHFDTLVYDKEKKK
ncbi:MAG: UDP-N-acetylmuramoyl-L-alanine--D-glutamate ligase [Ignavibacteriales bacterium]|nr:MAG: UDP-N-acetylmuramoyl-L-alanine--D-glutamate ligase [Ignavibacteriales bacterium]